MQRNSYVLSDDRYSMTARVLHWLMAVGFTFMWACGFAMTSIVEEDSAAEELLLDLHISTGVTLLILLVIRIGVRLLVAPPPLPVNFPRFDRIASHFGHVGLYILPALVIAAGWAETDFGGHGVRWFGVSMPKIFPTMETWSGVQVEDAAEEIHELLAWTMLALVVAHVAAVIKHRWFDDHDVLPRMTFGKKKG